MTHPSSTTDLIPIKSSTRTIQDCFRTCLYEVPNFQRPYSWGRDELEDYWNDVALAKGDFFFGSTVTWVSQARELFNDTYSIIDGQQRLTTSAIALSVIRDAFVVISQSAPTENAGQTDTDLDLQSIRKQALSQSENTQRYLRLVDDDGDEHSVIVHSEPNFRELVTEPGSIPSGLAWNGSAVQIGQARVFFEQKVQQVLQDHLPTDQLEQLKGIRNNVLKARIIQIELASEEDGFLIFETLNTRGADLRLADLVKNLLVRGGAKSKSDRSAVAGRWDRLVDRVQAILGPATSVDQFIWQSWNSRRTAVTEAELYKSILRLVQADPAKHIDYLQELEFDSIAYQYIGDVDILVDPSSISKRSALRVPEVIDVLRALSIFNVSVANSAMLAVVRKFEQTTQMTRKHLLEACRIIENFHFQFTALANSGSTGGTRKRYNTFAVALEQAKTGPDITSTIGALKDKLVTSLPSPEDARTAFSNLFYAPNMRLTEAQKRRGRKVFIAYVLLRIAQRSKAVPAGQDPTIWTIEHIRPQALSTEDTTDPVFSIGNLTLLTPKANGDLGDGDLSAKRKDLRLLVPFIDPVLAQWLEAEEKTSVEPADIRARARAIAVVAIANIWSV